MLLPWVVVGGRARTRFAVVTVYRPLPLGTGCSCLLLPLGRQNNRKTSLCSLVGVEPLCFYVDVRVSIMFLYRWEYIFSILLLLLVVAPPPVSITRPVVGGYRSSKCGGLGWSISSLLRVCAVYSIWVIQKRDGSVFGREFHEDRLPQRHRGGWGTDFQASVVG